MRWRPEQLEALERLKAVIRRERPTESLFEVEESLNFWSQRLLISHASLTHATHEGLLSRRQGRQILVSLGHIDQWSRGEACQSLVYTPDAKDPPALAVLMQRFPTRFISPSHSEDQRLWWSPVYLRPYLSETTWRVIAAPESGGAPGYSCRAWRFWERSHPTQIAHLRQLATRGLIRTWLVHWAGAAQIHPVDRDIWRYLTESRAITEARENFLREMRALAAVQASLPPDPFADWGRTPPLPEVILDENERLRKQEYLSRSGGVAPVEAFDSLLAAALHGRDFTGRADADHIRQTAEEEKKLLKELPE